jgi:GMP synthase (glutamine-hydrolysing)
LVIEPLKDLYKDEARGIGKKIGLPDELVMRHPFPGPGLSINVLCSNGTLDSEADFDAAQKAVEAFRITDFFDADKAPRLFVLPVKSVGVQGDFRTYRFPAALSWEPSLFQEELPWDKLEAVSSAITNSVQSVNRAVVELFTRKKDPNALRLQKGFCDKARLDQTREVDAIVLEELKAAGLYHAVFQHLTINLPYASSPARASFVLRPVVSEDVMTARFARLPVDTLRRIVDRAARLSFVDSVYYDITNKPPATFGWE